MMSGVDGVFQKFISGGVGGAFFYKLSALLVKWRLHFFKLFVLREVRKLIRFN